MKFFGFELRRKNDDELNQIPAIAPPDYDDGAITIPSPGAFGTSVDLYGAIKDEADLINRYRNMSFQPEVHTAIDEIVNEAVNIEAEDKTVDIVLDDVALSPKVKQVFEEEFDNILTLLNFNRDGYNIFRRYYIDGRLRYHCMIDPADTSAGIKEMRYLDARRMRKVREVKDQKVSTTGKTIINGGNGQITYPKVTKEYYIYSGGGTNGTPANMVAQTQNTTQSQGIVIAKDSIVEITSGLTDTNGNLVLSYLHMALRVSNQLRMIEDAMIVYRLTRSPERRVWYIDVGTLPRVKAEAYVRDIAIKHKNKLMYDPSSGCFAMDTKVPLLDGRTLTIAEIATEHEDGKEHWVYSCDPVTGKIVPGLVSWAGQTRENAEVMRLTLDNGEVITCTLDHKFPVWNKGFIEAKDLIVGELMMPLYRDEKQINNSDNTYQRIFQNDTKEWQYTHRMVAKWKKEVDISNETTFNKKYSNELKNTVHHVNFNRYDNTPFNLTYMNVLDHIEYHASVAGSRPVDSERYRYKNALAWMPKREKITEKNKSYNKIDMRARKLQAEYIKENHIIKYTDEMMNIVSEQASIKSDLFENVLPLLNAPDIILNWVKLNQMCTIAKKSFDKVRYEDIRKICEILGYNSWEALCSEKNPIIINNILYDTRTEVLNTLGITAWRKFVDPNISNRGSNTWKERLAKAQSKTWKVTTPTGNTEIIENLRKYCRDNDLSVRWIDGKPKLFKGYQVEPLHNHKIAKIEFLTEKMNVGTLSIDGKEIYHNHHTFALDAGIFTKNSISQSTKQITMLEDYFLPRREGGKGTEVSTLPPGQAQGTQDEIEHFQKLLYTALYVPSSRMSSDNIFSVGKPSEITRDEVKFAKFITRLRTRFNELFLKTLERQLVLKNIITIEEWDSIKHKIKFVYSKDNHFAELRDHEVMAARLDVLDKMAPWIGRFWSNRQIAKKHLYMDDEEMELNRTEIIDELADPIYNQPLPGQESGQEQSDDGSSEQQQAPTDGSPKDLENQATKLANAHTVYNLLKQKDKRSPKETTQFKSAAQILGKNKSSAKRTHVTAKDKANPPKPKVKPKEQ